MPLSVTSVEAHVQKFWVLSKAWKGESPFAEIYNYSSLINGIRAIKEQHFNHHLQVHAEELMDMVVRDKYHRAWDGIGGEVIHVDFTQKSVTKKDGQKVAA